MATTKRGLGRGLSALIPDAEMDALSDVTRDKITLPIDSSAGNARASSHGQSSSRPITGGVKAKASSELQTSDSDTATDISAVVATQRSTKDADEKNTDTKDKVTLAVGEISPNPFQPRRTFDEAELQDLAASIRLHGILQPILVRPSPHDDKTFQLVAGERRWRAAQVAGLDKVPVIIRPMADQQALELALIENVQRHDISAIDAAMAYQRLASEFSLSQEQISRRVGKSRSAVANTMRLLSLPEEARKAIEEGTLSEGHGRAILLASGEGARRALLRRVIRDKLSVREAERLAHDTSIERDEDQAKRGTGSTSPGAASNEWAQAERDAAKRLGVRVKIKATEHSGAIVLECGSANEVSRVLALLGETR